MAPQPVKPVAPQCQGFLPDSDTWAATTHIMRLEQLLKDRLDAIELKLDSAVGLLSTEIEAREAQGHRDQALKQQRRRERRMSGWGNSNRFGPTPFGEGLFEEDVIAEPLGRQCSPFSPCSPSKAQRKSSKGSNRPRGSRLPVDRQEPTKKPEEPGALPDGFTAEQPAVPANGQAELPSDGLLQLRERAEYVSEASAGASGNAPRFRHQEFASAQSIFADEFAPASHALDDYFSQRQRVNAGKEATRLRHRAARSNSTLRSNSSHLSAETSGSEWTEEKMHFSRSSTSLKLEKRSTITNQIWVFFEEPGSSPAADAYHRISVVLIFLSAAVPLLDTLPSPPLSSFDSFVVNTVIDGLFLVELILRWAACPNCLGFLLRFYNLLDFAIVGPCTLRAVSFYLWADHGLDPDWTPREVAQSILLCVVPVMRLVKALRAQRNFTLLLHTLRTVLEPLSVPAFMLTLMIVFFSCLLYAIEPRDNIPSVPHSMWLVIISVGTVGYGDVVPLTDAGKLVMIGAIAMGVLCTAMPLSIVGAAFTETWRNRTRIVIIRRMRDRLRQWGYSDDDLRMLHDSYDGDKDGMLNLSEFENLMTTMRLGLDSGQIARLFAVLDLNGTGALGCDEFVEGVGLNKHSHHHSVF